MRAPAFSATLPLLWRQPWTATRRTQRLHARGLRSGTGEAWPRSSSLSTFTRSPRSSRQLASRSRHPLDRLLAHGSAKAGRAAEQDARGPSRLGRYARREVQDAGMEGPRRCVGRRMERRRDAPPDGCRPMRQTARRSSAGSSDHPMRIRNRRLQATLRASIGRSAMKEAEGIHMPTVSGMTFLRRGPTPWPPGADRWGTHRLHSYQRQRRDCESQLADLWSA